MTKLTLRDLFFFFFFFFLRPDITAMVDWALKINYLSIYLFFLRAGHHREAFCPKVTTVRRII